MANDDPSYRAPRPSTVLESIESIREQIESSQRYRSDDLQAATVVDRFRPKSRPPMGLLRIADDGEESGELVRIRKPSTTIGRLECDVVIPHDNQMSAQHAEIFRAFDNGTYVWHLRDLNSTNGTFVRAAHSVLQAEQVLLMGGRRYRFECPEQQQAGNRDPTTDVVDGTRQWQQLDVAAFEAVQPYLVEMSDQGDGMRYLLRDQEMWIGTDANSCSIVLEDSFVSPQHARVYLDKKNRWCIESGKSLNGLWVGIRSVALGKGGRFQCGEQRFVFQVL